MAPRGNKVRNLSPPSSVHSVEGDTPSGTGVQAMTEALHDVKMISSCDLKGQANHDSSW